MSIMSKMFIRNQSVHMTWIESPDMIEYTTCWRRRAVAMLIVNELWQIPFLKRPKNDRTCQSMLTLPWGKIDEQDFINSQDSNLHHKIFAAIREALEETWFLVKWAELREKHYDWTSLVSGEKYRTYVAKVTHYTWRKIFISDEHEDYEQLSPEEYMQHPLAWPITKQIIQDYVNSLQW